ncbi:hypothetical protein FGO68_gene11921 [Halteria grandinella]|uniref:Mannosyltransferase n=1 Tax=Halteria grandinella TaxID=5974 RepID=A0A8J8SVN9_HALGN|nr:hypothetical protein FGO68_gene11921 [Halteria grandinella]
MTLLIPAMIMGGRKYYQRESQKFAWLLIIPALYIFFYTINPHKEIRFILPVVPIFLYFAGTALVGLMNDPKKKTLGQVYLSLHVVLNLLVLAFLSLFVKNYQPIISAVKSTPGLNYIYIFSWYDFPMYTELHGSGIRFEHQTCERMHNLFQYSGYDKLLHPFKRYINQTESMAEQSWINQVYVEGNQKLPEWVLAPKFIGHCVTRQRVLDELYDRYQEVFYELDLMQVRQGNWNQSSINYIIYKKKSPVQFIPENKPRSELDWDWNQRPVTDESTIPKEEESEEPGSTQVPEVEEGSPSYESLDEKEVIDQGFIAETTIINPEDSEI